MIFKYNSSLDIKQIQTFTKISQLKILDFGCGNGVYSEKVINFNPSKLTAIDISEEAIEAAKIKGNNKIDFKVENCENTKFNSDSFDIIYGVGILHHLNLDRSIKEIERLVKRDGNIIL